MVVSQYLKQYCDSSVVGTTNIKYRYCHPFLRPERRPSSPTTYLRSRLSSIRANANIGSFAIRPPFYFDIDSKSATIISTIGRSFLAASPSHPMATRTSTRRLQWIITAAPPTSRSHLSMPQTASIPAAIISTSYHELLFNFFIAIKLKEFNKHHSTGYINFTWLYWINKGRLS